MINVDGKIGLTYFRATVPIHIVTMQRLNAQIPYIPVISP
jgi:hypothetical protein